mmetsp:Transcript_1335/g.5306  ORF Transcript_1335/g.5306 Transcript_1335/m.5306 type:complete len:245 (+) Transcript_1335:2230-2964(+)
MLSCRCRGCWGRWTYWVVFQLGLAPRSRRKASQAAVPPPAVRRQTRLRRLGDAPLLPKPQSWRLQAALSCEAPPRRLQPRLLQTQQQLEDAPRRGTKPCLLPPPWCPLQAASVSRGWARQAHGRVCCVPWCPGPPGSPVTAFTQLCSAWPRCLALRARTSPGCRWMRPSFAKRTPGRLKDSLGCQAAIVTETRRQASPPAPPQPLTTGNHWSGRRGGTRDRCPLRLAALASLPLWPCHPTRGGA